ncbi:unnamed protein product [Discula destructiva]
MSHKATPASQGQRVARRAVVHKASFSEDDDAITPCSSPPPEPQDACPQQQPHQLPSFQHALSRNGSKSASSSPKTSTSASWHFDPTHGEAMSDAELWQRMLDIQKIFHCYNSARMSAALLELEMGVDAGHFAPSRSCLDLMNESVSDLSEDERQRLAGWVEENSTTRRRSAVWKQAAVFH